jgi:lactate dehydrogenase-like 2-hydroxyacid dehydrogenase
MKTEIIVTGPMPPVTLAALEDAFTVHRLWEAGDRAAFLKSLSDRVRGLASTSSAGVNGELMDALPKTEIIAHFGVGYDPVDVVAAKARSIAVTNTPDVLTDDVADLAIALVLDAARQISKCDRFVRAGLWLKGNHPLARTVTNKTLGIVGLGRIGTAIGKRAEAFKMKVMWHGPRPKADAPWPYVANLVELARQSDFLVVICPLTKETRHLITAEVMAALGPEGTIVNVARGAVIDEQAMVAALKAGTLGSAALDVFEAEPRVPEELFTLDNVVLQPHVGSATTETRAAMGQLVVDNLIAHFGGKPLLSQVA